MLYDVTIDGKNYRLELERAEGRWSCRLDGHEVEVDAVLARQDVLSLRIGNRAYEIKSEHIGEVKDNKNDWHVWVGSARFACDVRDPRALRSRARAADDHGPRKLTAPMPGKVVRVLVAPGDSVAAGQGLLVVEAMKMQNEMKASRAGRVLTVTVKEGATVAPGEILATLE